MKCHGEEERRTGGQRSPHRAAVQSQPVADPATAETQEHRVVFPTAPPLGAAASLSTPRGAERRTRSGNLRPAGALKDNCSRVCNKLLCYLAKRIFCYNEGTQNFRRFT